MTSAFKLPRSTTAWDATIRLSDFVARVQFSCPYVRDPLGRAEGLVVDALQMALARRRPEGPMIVRDPMPPEIAEKTREAVRGVVDAGGRAAHIAKLDDRHLVLILVFDGPEDVARVAREIGGPWIQESIVPLLVGDTERSVGEIIASAQA